VLCLPAGCAAKGSSCAWTPRCWPSANLTQSGVTKNIEADLFILGGAAPVRAADHVDALRSSGKLNLPQLIASRRERTAVRHRTCGAVTCYGEIAALG
jgi:hypothetical protein